MSGGPSSQVIGLTFPLGQILTDYQWSLVSGPNTGTELHLDPVFAQSWNTLVSGHKMWALLPPDTEHRLLECDPKCSGHDKVWP